MTIRADIFVNGCKPENYLQLMKDAHLNRCIKRIAMILILKHISREVRFETPILAHFTKVLVSAKVAFTEGT